MLKADMTLLADIEGQNRVCDEWRSPVRDKQIEAAKAAKIIGTRVVVGCEIGFRSVIEIANVVNSHVLAIHRCIREHSDFRFPIAI